MRNFIEYLESLNESKLLTSDFTFGFEFETCVKKGSYLYDKSYDDIMKILTDDFLEGMPSNDVFSKPKCEDDETIQPKSSKDQKFEYGSPAVLCKPIWINRAIECLKKWNTKYGCYTNDSCGFHVHLKYNAMNQQDVIWLYCNMATDKEFWTKFLVMDGLYVGAGKKIENRSYVFDGNYAKSAWLENLRTSLNHIDGNSTPDDTFSTSLIRSLDTRSKFRSFRLHPQGTIEWRGPRNFMDGGNILNIKTFFKMLLELVSYLRRYMDSDVLVGYRDGKETLTKKQLLSILFKDDSDEKYYIGSSELLIKPKGKGKETKYNTFMRQYNTSAHDFYNDFLNKPKKIINWLDDNCFTETLKKNKMAYEFYQNFMSITNLVLEDTEDNQKRYIKNTQSLFEHFKKYPTSELYTKLEKEYNMIKTLVVDSDDDVLLTKYVLRDARGAKKYINFMLHKNKSTDIMDFFHTETFLEHASYVFNTLIPNIAQITEKNGIFLDTKVYCSLFRDITMSVVNKGLAIYKLFENWLGNTKMPKCVSAETFRDIWYDVYQEMLSEILYPSAGVGMYFFNNPIKYNQTLIQLISEDTFRFKNMVMSASQNYIYDFMTPQYIDLIDWNSISNYDLKLIISRALFSEETIHLFFKSVMTPERKDTKQIKRIYKIIKEIDPDLHAILVKERRKFMRKQKTI